MESNKAKPIYRVKERKKKGQKRDRRREAEVTVWGWIFFDSEIRERKFISCFTTPFPGSEQTIYAFGLLSPT